MMRLSGFSFVSLPKNQKTGAKNCVFYIGPGEEEEKRNVLQEVFPSTERDNAPRLVTYNKGSDTFVSECLKTL